jgi:hypothetical protein
MKWLVAALYSFSAIVMFVSIAFIYNLGKKKVEVMSNELAERRAAAAIEAGESLDAPAEENAEAPEEIVEAAEEIAEATEEAPSDGE